MGSGYVVESGLIMKNRSVGMIMVSGSNMLVWQARKCVCVCMCVV